MRRDAQLIAARRQLDGLADLIGDILRRGLFRVVRPQHHARAAADLFLDLGAVHVDRDDRYSI